MEDKQFTTLIDKLDKLLRLQTIETVKGMTSEREKVELLDSVGFTPGDMDKLLGKGPGYSSSVLYQIRKKKQPKGPEKQTAEEAPAPVPDVEH